MLRMAVITLVTRSFFMLPDATAAADWLERGLKYARWPP